MDFMSQIEFPERNATKPDDTLILTGGREVNIAKGFTFGPYSSDFFDINYCKSGEIDLFLNDKLVKITPGMLYVIFPYTKVEKVFKEDTSSIYLAVIGDRVQEYLSLLGISSENVIFPHAIPQKTVEYLEQILDLLNTRNHTNLITPDEIVHPELITAPLHNDKERKIRRNGLFNLFISDLLSLLPANHEPNNPEEMRKRYVSDAIMYIRENYNFDISVDVVAKSVGLNRSYLYSLFQEYLGYSVQEFIIRTRINAARNLLRHYDTPIKDIAASIGYDPVTFSHAFKRINGMTANEYRKKNKKY